MSVIRSIRKISLCLKSCGIVPPCGVMENSLHNFQIAESQQGVAKCQRVQRGRLVMFDIRRSGMLAICRSCRRTMLIAI